MPGGFNVLRTESSWRRVVSGNESVEVHGVSPSKRKAARIHPGLKPWEVLASRDECPDAREARDTGRPP